MKKRIFSMLMALVMLFGSVVIPTVAETTGTTQAPASTASTSTVEVTPVTEAVANELTYTLFNNSITSSATYETKKKAFDINNGCWMSYFKGESGIGTDWNNYWEALKNKGFTKIVAESRNVLSDSVSSKNAVYANDQYMINGFLDAVNKRVYLTIEPIADMGEQGNYLSVFKAPSTIDRVCEPMLIQIGVDDNTSKSAKDTERSGMSYVLRTADGRFIVYDGGMSDSSNTLQNADKIYNVMKKNAPTTGTYANKVEIAAWLITHPHSDHLGALRSFVTRYVAYEGAPATLQCVIADFPSCGSGKIIAADADVDSAKIAVYDRYLTGLQHDGVDVYKAHTGQKYYFGDATIEILYTPQLAYPTQIGSDTDGTNGLSIVSRVAWSGAGTSYEYSYSAMFTGDATHFVIKKLNNLYGTAMKSGNFVQIPHHGNVDSYASTTEMKQLVTFLETNVAAKRYLIPTGVRHGLIVQAVDGVSATYESEERLMGDQYSNNPLIEANCSATVCVAGSSVWEFTLNPTKNGITSVEDAKTAGATYWAEAPTLADTTVTKKPDGSSAYYIYNRVGLMTLDRSTNYILYDDMTVPVIPGLTQFPICAEAYHGKFNGNKKTITLTSNGPINLELTASTGLLFESVGMIVYKYDSDASQTIAPKWTSSMGTVSSIVEKTGSWIKNLNVECPDVELTGNQSAQFAIFSGITWGTIDLENIAITSGTITKNTTNAANIGALIGKVRTGVTLTNCSYNGSILYGSNASGDARVGGLIGVVELIENNTAATDDTLDDALNWAVVLKKCKVNTSNTTGKVQGYNFAGGLIASLQASESNSVSLTVTNCTVDGAVEATHGTSSKAGGIVGTIKETATLTVSGLSNKADVSAYQAGGAVGYVETPSTVSVTGSSNAGTITSTKGSSTNTAGAAGGVIGTVAAAAKLTVDDFTNNGTIATATAGTASISAVVGQTSEASASDITVSNVTNSATISTDALNAGVLAGSLASGTTATFTSCTNLVGDLSGENKSDGLIGSGSATVSGCVDFGAAGVDYTPTGPITESFYVLTGARIRLSSGENALADSGLRFDIAIDEAMLAAYADAGYTVTVGSLMARTEALGSLGFTMEAMDSAGVKYSKSEMEYTEMKENGKLRANSKGNYYYTAALINIPEASYKTDYSCIGYILLEKDGESILLYSGFDSENNSRNIQQVAIAALTDTTVDYGVYKPLLKTFAMLPLEKENKDDQTHDASYFLTVS
ncbi:MAG: MBL fold metallo-hydrolase [Clostridia bacterium]|nr:MBL fold metallo-hydrolase [Clostridia bacterium]